MEKWHPTTGFAVVAVDHAGQSRVICQKNQKSLTKLQIKRKDDFDVFAQPVCWDS